MFPRKSAQKTHIRCYDSASHILASTDTGKKRYAIGRAASRPCPGGKTGPPERSGGPVINYLSRKSADDWSLLEVDDGVGLGGLEAGLHQAQDAQRLLGGDNLLGLAVDGVDQVEVQRAAVGLTQCQFYLRVGLST